MSHLVLKGNLLPPIPLAFRPPLYCREQMEYDPYVGLKRYGPYKAVSVKILHLKVKAWEHLISEELVDILCQSILGILHGFLKKAGKKVELEHDRIDSLSYDRNKTFKELKNIVDSYKEHVILVPLPRSKLRESSKLYAKMKAWGLKLGFVTQFYSDDRVLASVKAFIKKRDREKTREALSTKAILMNLALNILAKAGGIPWALYNELEYDIIIGLDWSFKREYLSTGPVIKTYGVVHTFNSLGVWEKVRSFICETKEDVILVALKESLEYVINDVTGKKKLGKILIMTKEHLKEKFLNKLSNYLNNHGYELDVVLISEHIPVRIYNTATATYLSPKGIYFIESENSAYIVTTGRVNDKYTGMGTPRPIRVKLLYNSDDSTILEALSRALKSVYALTAMNWRSFWGSLRVPTPIHYAKLVSRAFLMMDEEDIKGAFLRYGNYVYKPGKFEDRPWFI